MCARRRRGVRLAAGVHAFSIMVPTQTNSLASNGLTVHHMPLHLQIMVHCLPLSFLLFQEKNLPEPHRKVQTCRECEHEFVPAPNHVGFINVCPECRRRILVVALDEGDVVLTPREAQRPEAKAPPHNPMKKGRQTALSTPVLAREVRNSREGDRVVCPPFHLEKCSKL